MAVATFKSFNAIPGGRSKNGLWLVLGAIIAAAILLYLWGRSQTKRKEEEALRKRLEE